MDRVPNHFTESSARCPLRPKEMKLDVGGTSSDERFSETVTKPDERRGFRPAPRLHALHQSRGKHRSPGLPEMSLGVGDVSGAALQQQQQQQQQQTSQQLSETPMKNSTISPGPPWQGRRRSVEFAFTASPQLRLKAKAHAAGRPFRISETMPASSSRSLWVEGNSVLNADAGVASAALTHLSDCVGRERRLKEEWEAARFAKVQAFRAVVRVYMMSFTDTPSSSSNNNSNSSTINPSNAGGSGDFHHTSGRGITDTLAVARCSVVTNALVGTVQGFLRALRSRQLAAARGTLPSTAGSAFRPGTSSTDFALSFSSGAPPSRPSAEESTSASDTYTPSEALDLEEITRLKQLYFDYFDCEPVSISTMNPSGNDSSVFGTGYNPHGSRPSSISSMTDMEDFSTFASRTM